VWEVAHVVVILLSGVAVFCAGWLLAGRSTRSVRAKPPSALPVGYEQSDVRKLDEMLGTDKDDPQSWGSTGFGPLSDAQLKGIAERFHRNEFRREDLAALILEVRRVRLKNGPS
jgi:hypothetical protein